MRFMTTVILGATAVAVPLPAAPQDGATSCGRELAAFLETLRTDRSFPLVRAAYPDFESDLVEAVESDERTCFALLSGVRTRLFEAGYVVSGATDRAAVDRGRRLARIAATLPFDMDETDVAAETGAPATDDGSVGTDTAVRQAAPAGAADRPGKAQAATVASGENADAASGSAAATMGGGAAARGEAAAGVAVDGDGAVARNGVGPFEVAPPQVPARGGTGDGSTRARRPPSSWAGLAAEIAERERAFARAAAGTGTMDMNIAADTRAALETVAIREVEFPSDSATVPLEGAARALADVAEAVETAPSSTVLLTGYASPVGEGGYNMNLSEAQVNAVRDALVDLGVPRRLIRTRSLGQRNPEVAAGAGERSPPNRRVEIRVIDIPR